MKRARAFLVVSLALAAVHLANLVWWRVAFGRGQSQAERVAMYLAPLPPFLTQDDPARFTLVLTLAALIGAGLGLAGAFSRKRSLVILGVVGVSVNGLFALWYLFTLM